MGARLNLARSRGGWTLLRRFEVTDPRGLGVVAHVHLVHYVDEVRNDPGSRHRNSQTAEQLVFDFHHPWSRCRPGDPS